MARYHKPQPSTPIDSVCSCLLTSPTRPWLLAALPCLLLREVRVVEADGVDDAPKRGAAEVIRMSQLLPRRAVRAWPTDGGPRWQRWNRPVGPVERVRTPWLVFAGVCWTVQYVTRFQRLEHILIRL